MVNICVLISHYTNNLGFPSLIVWRRFKQSTLCVFVRYKGRRMEEETSAGESQNNIRRESSLHATQEECEMIIIV